MSDLKSAVISLVNVDGISHVWVPTDFAAFGSRDAVDKTLQRMVRDGELRRIDRGLYDRPTINRLTKRPTNPDYRAVVDAIARRDQLRLLVDGMTAANDRRYDGRGARPRHDSHGRPASGRQAGQPRYRVQADGPRAVCTGPAGRRCVSCRPYTG